MKKYFNESGTITGWQAIGRYLISYVLYAVLLLGISTAVDHPIKVLLFLPIIVPYVWITVTTTLKRHKSFGFVGRWYNVVFPVLTDGTYPNGKEEEK